METAHSRITATGTAFNVDAHKEDSMTTITLATGILDIQLANSAPLRLTPGDHASYNNQTQRCFVKRMDPYKWYAWKDGLMIFRDDPLSYVFKRLEQTFNVEINVNDAEIESAHYRATFENESLNEIFRLLEQSAPIHFVYLDREKSADDEYEKQEIEVRRKAEKP